MLAIHWQDVVELYTSTNPDVQTKKSSVFTRSDFIKAWLKIILFAQSAFNFERMQGTAYAFIMSHIEEKLRKNPEELKSWMKLHNEFFNTHPAFTSLIVGINTAVEEGGADHDTVRTLKTSLMRPFAGLGDGLFWFTWRLIVFGIGAGLAITAGVIGPIAAFILWCPVLMILAWYFLNLGYKYGVGIVQVIRAGKIETIRRLASILAVTIIAALSVTAISVKTPIVISVSGAQPIDVQSAIDKIMPKMIQLITIIGAYYLYKRGYNITKVLTILFVVGFVLGLLGIIVRP